MFSRVRGLSKLLTVSSESFMCKCGKTRDAKLNQFSKPNVQKILKQLTRIDVEQVLSSRKFKELRIPTYKLLTSEQLAEEEAKTERKIRWLLQMPPVLEPREEIDEILSIDPSLDGFDVHHSKYVFADISDNISDADRLIVVREPNGILRKANWDERFRVNQIYFPQSGRQLTVPKLFQEEYLNDLLERKEYKFILDSACIQFEPDDPLYINITSKVYDKINSMFHFSKLYSTRHFGSMTFYLVYNKNIDNMLADNIQNDRIEDAYLLVTLYGIIHPECNSASLKSKSKLEKIQNFINKDANNSEDLKLVLQVFMAKNKEEKTASAA